MRQQVLSVLLVFAVAAGLGATVFREQVAAAAQLLNVQVMNDAANPVPVVQQGPLVEQVPETVQLEAAFIAQEDSGEASQLLYVVPTGKRLVIEYANFELRYAGGTVIPELETVRGFSALQWALPIQRTVTFATSVISTGSLPTTIYLEAGERVSARVEKANRDEVVVAYIKIAGHLVNVS